MAGRERQPSYDRLASGVVSLHSAWIAARWSDPAFPRAFPWFTSPRYWQEHLSDLWQQLEASGVQR